MRPASEEELVRLVSDDLEDTGNVLTYSDWLLERGRRRGERRTVARNKLPRPIHPRFWSG
jgi:uncharacterized protein (TIGR02996 family)